MIVLRRSRNDRMNIGRTGVLLLAGAMLALTLAPRPALAASLEAELAQLLVQNPDILAAEKQYYSAGYGVDIAEGGFMPQVNLTTSAGPQVISTPFTRSEADPKTHRTSNVATLTVNQNLYDGDLTASNTKAARLTVEAARIALEQARDQTMFKGVQAYINVVRQKRLADLGFENVQNIEQQLNLEDERVQRGSGIAIDVLEAKSRLQIAKERLVGFEGALRNASATYKQVFGHTPDVDNMTDPELPVDLIPVSLQDAISIALLKSPALKNSATAVEIAHERQEGASATYMPSVDLQGSMNYERNNDGTIGIRRDYSVLVSMSWDLFTGLTTPASVNQAAYAYRASQDTHLSTVRSVQEQVRIAWASLITTRNRAKLLENAVNIAAEVYSSRQKLRAAGKENVINVLDAENQVTSAQINFASTSYDVRLASYQLLLSMGQLTPENLNVPTA